MKYTSSIAVELSLLKIEGINFQPYRRNSFCLRTRFLESMFPCSHQEFCYGEVDEEIEVFLNDSSLIAAIEEAGIKLFRFIYHSGNQTLSKSRFTAFSKQAASGKLSPQICHLLKDQLSSILYELTCNYGIGSH